MKDIDEELEQAAASFYDNCCLPKSSWWADGVLHKMSDTKETFIAGANWQKERGDIIAREAEAERVKGYQQSYELGVGHTLSRAMDEGTLVDWYISSIDETVLPCWTEEHIAELCKDFYVIPKN